MGQYVTLQYMRDNAVAVLLCRPHLSGGDKVMADVLINVLKPPVFSPSAIALPSC